MGPWRIQNIKVKLLVCESNSTNANVFQAAENSTLNKLHNVQGQVTLSHSEWLLLISSLIFYAWNQICGPKKINKY